MKKESNSREDNLNRLNELIRIYNLVNEDITINLNMSIDGILTVDDIFANCQATIETLLDCIKKLR